MKVLLELNSWDWMELENDKLVIFFSEILECYVAAVPKKKFSEYISQSGIRGWQYLCNGYNYGPLKGHICAYRNRCEVVAHKDFHKEVLKVKHLWNDHAKVSRYMCGQSNTLGFIRLKTSLILCSKYKNLIRLRKLINLNNEKSE